MALAYEPEEVNPPDPGTHNIVGAAATEFASGAARSLMAPVLDQLSEGTEFATERLGVPLQGVTDYLKDSAQTWRRIGDAIHSTLSEERRRQAEASFVPKEGQPSAWSAPFGTATMHLFGGLPVMVAVAATKNPYAAAGVGAVQAQAQRLSDVRGMINNATDDELAQAHPKFAEWTRMGLPPGEARRLLENELASLGTRAIEAVGGAAGAAPLGHIAGGGVKAATLRGTVGRGALEGGGGMAVQSGLHEVAEQQGQRNTGARQRFDGSDIARASLAGAIEGTAIGGGFAGVHGLPGAVRKRASEYVAKRSTIDPSPDQQAVLKADQQPGPPPTQPPAGPATGLDAAIAAKEAELAEAAPPAAPTPDGTAPGAANKASELPGAMAGMAQGITGSLYDGLFKALQEGKTKFAGITDPVLAWARPLFDAGLIKSADDLRRFVNNPETFKTPDAVPPAPEKLGQALDTAPAHHVPPVPDTIIREDAGAKVEQLSRAMTDTATAPTVEPAKAAPEQTVLPPFNEAAVTDYLRKTGSAGTSALARHFGVSMAEAGALLKSLEGKVISRPDKKGLRKVLGVERAKVDAATFEGKANELLATQPDAATLVKTDTSAEQIASKVAGVTAPKVPTKVSPAAKAARGIGDTVGKETGRKLASAIKKAVTPVIEKIAESRAETQTEIERARAEDRPATLKPAPDANKLTQEAAGQAVQQVRDADAERKAKARERQRKETDRQARDILEGTWVHKLDSGDAHADGRPTQDALSRFAKRYQSLVDRAQQDRLPVIRDGKIVNERTSKANLEGDADEMPHVSFLRDVARWLRRVEDYKNNPHHNKLPPIEKGLIDLITQEGSLANKDFAAAAEARRMRQSADREYRAGDDTITEKVDQTSMGESPEEAMLRAEREREEAEGVDDRTLASLSPERRAREIKHAEEMLRQYEKLVDNISGTLKKLYADLRAAQERAARGDKVARATVKTLEESIEYRMAALDAANEDVLKYGQRLQKLRGGRNPWAASAPPVDKRVSAPQGGRNTDGIGGRAKPEFWDAVNNATARSVDDVLRGINIDAGGGVRNRFRVMGIIRAVRRDAGRVPVVVIPDEAMAHYGPEYSGLFIGASDAGLKAGKRGLIVIRESANNIITNVHEAAHAATAEAMFNDKALRDRAEALFDFVKRNADPNDVKEYGFTNAHEFIAEAMGNPHFQQVLMGIAVPKSMAKFSVRSVWDQFVRLVARALHLPNTHVTALDAALRLYDEAATNTTIRSPGHNVEVLARRVTKDDAVEYWRDKVGTSNEWKLRTQRTLDKLASLTQLGNTSDALFGPNKPARRLVEALAKVHNERERIQEKDAELLRRTFDAQRRYGAETFREFSSILNDETSSGLFLDKSLADHKNLSKSEQWRAEVNHDAMQKRWNDLIAKAPELAALRTELHQMFRERQREMSLQLINNQLRALSDDGQGSPALAQRILDNKMSNADKAVLGDNLPRIKEAAALTVKSGPYVPLMRHGDFVVQGRYKIDAPADARRLNGDGADDPAGNIFEFKTAEAAKRFVQNEVRDLHSEVEAVYVDPETGSTKGVDEGGKEVRITKDDTNSEKRWRVEVQDRHVEFFERQRHAEARRDELVNDKRITDVADVDLRRLNAADLNLSFMPAQLQRLAKNMQKRNSFKEMPAAAQREVMRQLLDTSIAAMGTTRAQTRRLPRTNVRGAADDIARAAQGYSTSTANYLGRLKHQPEADAIMKEMTKLTDEARYEKGPKGAFDDMQVLRRQRLQEFERRLYSGGEYTPTNWFSTAASRVLQMSYLDKLASPAYHVINSMEPWTVSMPVLAAKHGAMATVRALHEAYGAIGAARVLGAGAKDTAKAFRQDAGFTDYAKTFKERVAGAPDGAELVAMFDKLTETGLLSRNAGQELTRASFENTSLAGRALDRGDLMARQFGTAVEGVNRAVTGIAAYRLARRRGMDAEAARAYAVEAVHDTMGNYNAWNSAPIFNHPLGRLALQFRKYAQKTYYLLGKQVSGMRRGDPEAYKTFAGLMATHFMVAGTLGLPLEPLRAAMLAAGLLGITDAKYDDLEQNVRRGASAVFGKTGGEIFSRGPARLLGIDLASRMGLDGLIMQPVDPKSMKKDDLYAYFAKSFAGAPADFLFDASQGFQALGRGDVDEALRLLVPLKIFADGIQSYQMMTQGKQSAGGREQARKWTALEGATKLVGFTPATVAEEQEQSFAIRGDQKVLRDQRQKLIGDWIKAQPADRDYQWQAILRWNKGQPKNAWISRQDVLSALQRKLTEERSGTYAKGVRYSARDKHLQEQNSFYNVQ